MRKISIVALLLALTMIFAGCSNLITVNEERDMQRVVIKVNNHEITKQEYADTYYSFAQYYMYYYGATADDLKTSDSIQMLQEGTIAEVVNQAILVNKAQEYGCYDFTQEEQDELQSQFDELMTSYRGYSISNVEANEENKGLSQEELDKLVEEDLAKTLEEFGFSEELYIQELKDNKAKEKIMAIITETTPPTESEIQAAYDLKVADQQASFTENPTGYETAIFNGSTIYYNLPDARTTRHILISLPDDIKTQITAFRENEDNESADALLKEELPKIKAAADEVYNLAIEGANFNELITEHGEDPGMEEENYYTVIKNSQALAPEFTAGLYSLEAIGDFTQPISSDFGYHIILYVDDVKEGPVALEDVKEGIIDELNSNKENELYNAQMVEWNEQAKIKIYDSRLDLDLD